MLPAGQKEERSAGILNRLVMRNIHPKIYHKRCTGGGFPDATGVEKWETGAQGGQPTLVLELGNEAMSGIQERGRALDHGRLDLSLRNLWPLSSTRCERRIKKRYLAEP